VAAGFAHQVPGQGLVSMSFFAELRRRNVFRVAIAYVVAAWVLLQVADLVLDNIEAPDWVMQVLMLVVALGFVAALVVAWAYELTPEGIRLEKNVERSQSITAQTGRKLDRIIIAFLAVAVVLLLGERFVTHEAPEAATSAAKVAAGESGQAQETPVPDTGRDRSIAVLPLANRSTRAEDAFFAEGIHDELLTKLSRISALRVISRTSVMGYAGTTKRMPEIGRELGVATLLEGGVQRSGDRVRINVQLIDADNDEHLWAETYDRELTADNLFEIQSDITRSIANALQAVLTGEEQQGLARKPTENVEAYTHYLRARAAASAYGRNQAQIEQSIAAYRRAIELDPGFAAAYAALSIDWCEWFWATGRERDTAPALEALQRARSLAPRAVETLTAAGYYHYWCHLDYDPALTAFDQSLADRPGSPLALRGRAYVLRRMGRLDDTLEAFGRILALDPLNANIYVDQAYTLSQTGRLGEARSSLDQARVLGARFSFTDWVDAQLLMMEGRLEDAWEVLGPLDDSLPFYYEERVVQVARSSRDAERIGEVLAYFDTHAPDESELTNRKLLRARILWDRGAGAELAALLDGLEPLLAEASDNAIEEFQLLNLALLYAMRGDQARLDETIERYEMDLKPDAMRPVEQGWKVPVAYAMVGDANSAIDHIQRIIDGFGIWSFYTFAQDPVFDAMRDDPRFQALAGRHREWLEGNRP
jgi:TolB-like protein